MIDFLQKSIFALLRMDDQQKGTDFPERHKTAYLFLCRHSGSRSTRSGSFIFKMAAMLQIPRVFPLVSCLGSAKVVQCPRPEPKIGDKSQQIPRYSPVCPRVNPPGWPLISAFLLMLNVTEQFLKNPKQKRSFFF